MHLKILASFLLFLFWSVPDVVADPIRIRNNSQSDLGPIWVFDHEGQRCISLDPPPKGAALSCMLIENPQTVLFDYTRLMVSTVFLHDHPQKILMMGLGGGSIAKAINTLLPQAEFDIVEINQEIVRLSKEFFAFIPATGTKIYVEDGVNFAGRAKDETYDLIILDAFNKDYIPSSMLTQDFIDNIKRILKKDGVVTINTFASSKYHDHETSLFIDAFGEIYDIVAQGNRIIFAKQGQLPEPEEVIKNSAFWRFKFAQIGIEQVRISSFFNTNSRKVK